MTGIPFHISKQSFLLYILFYSGKKKPSSMPSYGLEIKTSAFWVYPNSHVGYLIPSMLLLQQNKNRTKTNRDMDR